MSGARHSEAEPLWVCSGERSRQLGKPEGQGGRWEGVRVAEPHEAASGAATAFTGGRWCACVSSSRKPKAC